MSASFVEMRPRLHSLLWSLDLMEAVELMNMRGHFNAESRVPFGLFYTFHCLQIVLGRFQ